MKKTDLMIFIMMLGTFGVLSTEMGMIGILPQTAQFFNVSIDKAGLFVSLFAVIIAASGLVLPLVCSRYDRKKVFLLSLGLFVIFNIIGAFMTEFYPALICRLIPAFFMPVYCSISLTAAGEIVPPDEAQDAISRVIMGVSAGMIVGVPIAAFFASFYGFKAATLWFAFVNLLGFIATLIWFPSLPGKEESYSDQLKGAFGGLFFISIIGVILLNCGMFLSYTYISEFLQGVTHIVRLDLTITLFVYGIFSIIGNWLGGKLLSRNANKLVLSIPFMASAVFLILFFIGALKIPVLICIPFWGVLAGIMNDILPYWIVSAVPQAPEFANGVFLSLSNVGGTIGTSIGGWLIVTYATQYIFLGSIAVLMLAFLAVLSRVKIFDVSS